MTKYFIDNNGAYVGGFDGVEPPDGSIEVPTPPNHSSQTWDGQKWTGDDYLWKELRAKRNALLAQSDWTQVADSPLSTEQKLLWAEYRQLLRDITNYETPTAAMNELDALTPPSGN